MQLIPDYSLVLQILIFVVLWQILKRILFEPFQKVLKERERRTVGARAEAEQLRSTATGAREEYKLALRDARVRIAQESEATRKAAQEEQSKAVNEARAAAGAELTRLRATLSQQVDEARKTLAAQANTIAFEMLDRVTGRSQA